MTFRGALGGRAARVVVVGTVVGEVVVVVVAGAAVVVAVGGGRQWPSRRSGNPAGQVAAWVRVRTQESPMSFHLSLSETSVLSQILAGDSWV